MQLLIEAQDAPSDSLLPHEIPGERHLHFSQGDFSVFWANTWEGPSAAAAPQKTAPFPRKSRRLVLPPASQLMASSVKHWQVKSQLARPVPLKSAVQFGRTS